MSDTPRTDAKDLESWNANAGNWMDRCTEMTEFARQLERELRQITKERDDARQHIAEVHADTLPIIKA